jgi:hypothetical protein
VITFVRTHVCSKPNITGSHVCRSCSKCKWRKGRSAFRHASRQSGRRINTLYEIHELNGGRTQRLAGEKLRKWGFNPLRRCLLPVVCDRLLIRTRGYQDDLFPTVDWRDKLHGLLTFLHRTLFTPFSKMSLPQKLRLVLDQRLTQLGLKRIMRNPNTGTTYRVQKSVFKDTDMSGEDKVHWIFLVPHVLGYRALCLPEDLREPVLTAFAHAQIMVMASRGFRSYNRAELELVFDQGYVALVCAMERIHAITHTLKYRKQMKRHRKRPRTYAAPKRFKPPQR